MSRPKLMVRVKPTTYVLPEKTYYMYRNGRRIPVHRKRQVVHRKGFTQRRKDVGAPGRGKKLIKVKKGLLKKYGYSTSLSDRSRRIALERAVRVYGPGRVWHMLNAQVNLRLHQGGKAARTRAIFEADRDWVASRWGGPRPPRRAIEAARRANLRKGKNPFGPG